MYVVYGVSWEESTSFGISALSKLLWPPPQHSTAFSLGAPPEHAEHACIACGACGGIWPFGGYDASVMLPTLLLSSPIFTFDFSAMFSSYATDSQFLTVVCRSSPGHVPADGQD